ASRLLRLQRVLQGQHGLGLPCLPPLSMPLALARLYGPHLLLDFLLPDPRLLGPYVVWSKNYRRAEFLWNILIFYTAFPCVVLPSVCHRTHASALRLQYAGTDVPGHERCRLPVTDGDLWD